VTPARRPAAGAVARRRRRRASAVLLLAGVALALVIAPAGARTIDLVGADLRIDGVGDEGSGAAVATGDFDGDGRPDMIVGAPRHQRGDETPGAAYVVFGGEGDVDLGALGARGYRIDGVGGEDRTGLAVAGTGDLNGDGRDDLMVGAPGAEPFGRFLAGAAYVIISPSRGDIAALPTDETGVHHLDLASLGTRGYRIDGTDESSTGSSLASGELGGTVGRELLVGATSATYAGRSYAGAVFVMNGVPPEQLAPFIASLPDDGGIRHLDLESFDNDDGYRIGGAAKFDDTGASIAVGDVDADGRNDILVGVPGVDRTGAFDVGSVAVVFRHGTGDVDLAQPGPDVARVVGGSPLEEVGAAVASADVDGDGDGEVVAGAPTADHTGCGFCSAGAAYVIFDWARGETRVLDALAPPSFRVDGVRPFDRTGKAVAAADIDGDGKDDVIVGAPEADTAGTPGGGTDAGSVYVLLGSALGQPFDLGALEGRGHRLNGDPREQAGTAIAAADATLDRPGVLTVGAPEASSGSGAVTLVTGKLLEHGVTTASISGIVSTAGFGRLRNARVEICTVDGTFCVARRTNSDGVYLARALPPGQYAVTARPPIPPPLPNLAAKTVGPLELLPGGRLKQDFALVASTATIFGHVSALGVGALAGATVEACTVEAGECVSATTAPITGEYRITGLSAGEYVLTARPPVSSPLLDLTPQSIGPVAVEAGDALRRDFLLWDLPPPLGGGTRHVAITDDGFQPSEVNVLAGQSIHWTNHSSSPQTVTADSGLFDSGELKTRSGFTAALSVPGAHSYGSASHPERTGVVRVYSRGLAGPAAEPANKHIPEIPFPEVDAEDVTLHPRLAVEASRTLIVVAFRETATVAGANKALADADILVIGGLPDLGLLLVRANDSGDFSGLDTALRALRRHDEVQFASMSFAIAESALPRRAEEDVEGGWGWKWTVSDRGGNWGLRRSRFPAAWNLLETLESRPQQAVTAILDAGFAADHADLKPPHASFEIVTQVCRRRGTCLKVPNIPNNHGTKVAGIVGAAFDNPIAPEPPPARRSLGVSGANPVARIKGYSLSRFADGRKTLGGAAHISSKAVELFRNVLDAPPPGLRVINYSAGVAGFDRTVWSSRYLDRTCGPGATDDELADNGSGLKEYCTPNNSDEWLREFGAVGQTFARVARKAAASNVLIVQSAGNDSDKFRPPGHGDAIVIDARNRNEFAWASANWSSDFVAGRGHSNPIVVVQAIDTDGSRPTFSNVGGDIAAPGVAVVSTTADGRYAGGDGTSFAAPHVSALLSYLLALEPQLNGDELRRKLLDWSEPGPRLNRSGLFEWSVPDRFGRDDDLDGLVDYPTPSDIDPGRLSVRFDACGSRVRGKPIGHYAWSVDGEPVGSGSDCTFSHDFPAEGSYGVTLTVTAEGGITDRETQQVEVKDHLIASLGDSIASGEGNPDVPKTGLMKAPKWQDRRCHRSAKAGPALAARWLEMVDIRSSVTFVHLACSGARIEGDVDELGRPVSGDFGEGGLISPFRGIEPEEPPLAPQIDQLRNLVGSRKIDSLLLSIGANDMGFGAILADCISPLSQLDCNVGKGKQIFDQRIGLLRPRFDKLAEVLRSKFPSLPSNRIYVAEYPDPTRNQFGQVDMSCVGNIGLVTADEAVWAAGVVVPRLNQEIRDAAMRNHWALITNIASDFSTHGYCSGESNRWVVSITRTLLGQGGLSGLMHPNFAGQSAYAARFVPPVKDALEVPIRRQRPLSDIAPRVDAYMPALTTRNAARKLVDMNDVSRDGNRRIEYTRDADGALLEKIDEKFSDRPEAFTAPDGLVDMRDFRRFRDAWLLSCWSKSQPFEDVNCPPKEAIALDGEPRHAKKDLNLDRCVFSLDKDPDDDDNCSARETDYPRFDFNGDRAISPTATNLVPLKEDGTPATHRGEAARLTDLDLLASQWTPASPNTERWQPQQLGSLMRSADLEIHADSLFDDGASSVEVSVSRPQPDPAVPLRTLKRGDGSVLVTVPLASSTDRIEVTGRASVDGEVVEATEAVTLKYGEDRRLDLCTTGVKLHASPVSLPADGEATAKLTATVRTCGERRRPGLPVEFGMTPAGDDHAAVAPATAKTDAKGRATTIVTAGKATANYTITASVKLDEDRVVTSELVLRVSPKLYIHYLWQQESLEWWEEGTTRWIRPALPDCWSVEYCVDHFRVQLVTSPTPPVMRRVGTLSLFGKRTVLDEDVEANIHRSETTWTLSNQDGSNARPGRQIAQWGVAVPDPDAEPPAVGPPWEYHGYDKLTGIGVDELPDEIRVKGLRELGNLGYKHTAVRQVVEGLPDNPADLPTTSSRFMLVPRHDRSAFRYSGDVDHPIVFERKQDGSIPPYHFCGSDQQLIHHEPGYWAASPSPWVIDGLDRVRKFGFTPGDRPAPTGSEFVRVRYSFAAVASYSPERPQLVLPDCTKNEPPEADFVPPSRPVEGRPSVFADRSKDFENNLLSWRWVFADGKTRETRTEHDPQYFFADNGSYDVELTVTDGDGASDSETKQLLVKNAPPEAELDDAVGQAGKPVALSFRLADAGPEDKKQLRYRLVFDGQSIAPIEETVEGGPQSVTVTGLPAGTHSVTLTVTDKEGAQATDTATIKLTAQPPEPPPAPADKATCDNDVRLDAEEQAFFDAVNEYRIDNGLEPLEGVSPTLTTAADAHVRELAERGELDHIGRDGSNPLDRALKAGYKRVLVGENLLRGAARGVDALWAWRASQSGHNETMLHRAWEAVGVARVSATDGWYWATTFGAVLDCPPGAPPARTAGPTDARAGRAAPTLSGSVNLLAEGAEPTTLTTGAGVTPSTPAADYPPVSAFVVAPATPEAGHRVTFRNASRDAAGTPLAAVLDTGDGSEPVSLGPGASRTHVYASVGEFSAKLIAENSAGLALTATRVVQVVPNRPPILTFVGPAEGAGNGRVTFKARALDEISDEPVPGLEIGFTIGTHAASATTGDDGVAAATVVLDLAPGQHMLDLVFAGDAAYQPASVKAAFRAFGNAPPLAAPGGPYVSGMESELLIDGSTSADPDAGDHVVSHAWDLNDDGEYGELTGPTPPPLAWDQVQTLVCGGTCTPDAPYRIALRVADTHGTRSVAATTVTFKSDFGLQLGASTIALVPGESNTVAVSVIGAGGFTTPVTLSAVDLPAGVAATFTPNPVVPTGSAALTLTAGPGAPLGAFPLVIVGTGGGHTRELRGVVRVAFGLIPVCYGTLTGRVTDAQTGAPLAGVSISPSGGRTDAAGRYTVNRIPLGENNAPLTLSASADKSGYWDAQRGAVFLCGAVTRLDFELLARRTGAVAGRIVVGTLGPDDASGSRNVIPTDSPIPDSVVAGVRTDAQGRYSASLDLARNNTPQRHRLVATAPGYWHQEKAVDVEAAVTKAIDFELVAVCYVTVRGHATRLTGEPAANRPVFLHHPQATYVTQTDEAGNYRFDPTPLGYNNSRAVYTLNLDAALEGDAAPEIKSLAVESNDCGKTFAVDLTLRKLPPPPAANFATVEGVVVDGATRRPIEGAKINGKDTTGPDGRYRTTVFVGSGSTHSSTQFVSVSSDGYWSGGGTVRVNTGQTSQLDLELERKQRGTVRGVVRDAATDQPLAGVHISSGLVAEAVSDAEGRYHAEGPVREPTSGQLTASVSGYWEQGKTAVVRPGETTTVDFALLKKCTPASIVGTVVNAVTQEPIHGALVNGVRTDATGKFELRNIPLQQNNRPWQVSVTASAQGFFPQTKVVTVFCGATIVIDFGTATTAVGTILGTITTSGGKPLTGVFVGSEFGASALTDAAGNYRLDAAPLGPDNADRTWKVTALPPDAPPQTKETTVRAGSVSRVDFTVEVEHNRRPVATAQALTVAEDASVPIVLAATDEDGDALAFSLVSQPEHGTLAGTPPHLTYTPAADFHGSDSFTFRAGDGHSDSEAATVSITIESVNDEPTARADAVAVTEDESASLDVLANDAGGPADESSQVLAPTLLRRPANGLASVVSGRVSYAPVPNFNGLDSFAYLACDDGSPSRCASAEVTITVKPVNDPPTARDGAVTLEEDAQPVAIDLGALVDDVETTDTSLTYEIVSGPAHGKLSNGGPKLQYRPHPDAHGADSFTFNARDGGDPHGCARNLSPCAPEQESGVRTVDISITPVNDAPLVTFEPVAPITEGAPPVTLVTHASDADGDRLTYTWRAEGGQLDAAGQTARYSHADGPASPEISVTVSDGELYASAERVVEVRNVAPTVEAGEPRVAHWGLPIAFDGTVTDPSATDTRAGFDPTWFFGDGSGPAQGLAVSHAYAAPGPYVARLLARDKDGAAGDDRVDVTIVRRGSSLSYTGASHASFGLVAMTARLIDTVDASTAKLAGKQIDFQLGSLTLTALTDATGTATAVSALPLDVGTHTVDVRFAGDSHYSASATQARLVVANSPGKVTGGSLRTNDGGRGGVTVQADATGAVKGELQWQKATDKVHVHGLTALGISPRGNAAWFAGAAVDGRRVVGYAEDNGEPGSADLFRLWLDGRPVTAEGTVTGGNIQIHGRG
jgi:uncharacterized protein YkwD